MQQQQITGTMDKFLLKDQFASKMQYVFYVNQTVLFCAPFEKSAKISRRHAI
jgi:hypothetical protein